jgi:hypothetical protein
MHHANCARHRLDAEDGADGIRGIATLQLLHRRGHRDTACLRGIHGRKAGVGDRALFRRDRAAIQGSLNPVRDRHRGPPLDDHLRRHPDGISVRLAHLRRGLAAIGNGGQELPGGHPSRHAERVGSAGSRGAVGVARHRLRLGIEAAELIGAAIDAVLVLVFLVLSGVLAGFGAGLQKRRCLADSCIRVGELLSVIPTVAVAGRE